MFFLWLKFIIAAAGVVFCGYKLCVYGDEIGQITRLGRSFIGLILLAVVTSLPELAVSLSAGKIGALDLALGNVFGSNLFNLAIFGLLLILFIRPNQVLSFDSVHFLNLGFSLLLLALPAIGILFYKLINPVVGFSRIFLDVETLLILGVYVLGVFLAFKLQPPQAQLLGQPVTANIQAKSSQTSSPARIWLNFSLFTAILVVCAVYLSRLGEQIAGISVAGVALGGTFIGSFLLAMITSLPELAVSIAAVRLGFWDLALGNIFGSNMFNLCIIGIMDLAIGQKIILSAVSALHLFTALFILILSGLVCASLIYRSRHKYSGLAWDSIAILLIYFAANFTNFYLR